MVDLGAEWVVPAVFSGPYVVERDSFHSSCSVCVDVMHWFGIGGDSDAGRGAEDHTHTACLCAGMEKDPHSFGPAALQGTPKKSY